MYKRFRLKQISSKTENFDFMPTNSYYCYVITLKYLLIYLSFYCHWFPFCKVGQMTASLNLRGSLMMFSSISRNFLSFPIVSIHDYLVRPSTCLPRTPDRGYPYHFLWTLPNRCSLFILATSDISNSPHLSVTR